MAYVLQLMAATGKTISQLVAEIPRYEIVKTKFECRREDANRAVEAIKKAVRHREDRHAGRHPHRLGPTRWVHARPSNTEPIMRIIAEAPDRATAEAMYRAGAGGGGSVAIKFGASCTTPESRAP